MVKLDHLETRVKSNNIRARGTPKRKARFEKCMITGRVWQGD